MDRLTVNTQGSAAAPDRRRLRARTLTPPRGILGRIGHAAQDLLEAGIAAVSVHGDPLVYDAGCFPWVPALEARWRGIREELDMLLAEGTAIPCFQDIVEEVRTIQRDTLWKTYFLKAVGMDCRDNAARCPRTMEALALVPDVKNAFFSIFEPGKHVPPHRGAYNGVLRLHLGLRVADPARCGLRVGDRLCRWEEGRALIFDDSFNHEAWNDSGDCRVVLFVDFARPLKRPWHRLHSRVIDAGALAPFMRRAARRQREWLRKQRRP